MDRERDAMAMATLALVAGLSLAPKPHLRKRVVAVKRPDKRKEVKARRRANLRRLQGR